MTDPSSTKSLFHVQGKCMDCNKVTVYLISDIDHDFEKVLSELRIVPMCPDCRQKRFMTLDGALI